MARVRIGPANEVRLPEEVMRELEVAPGDIVEIDRTNGTIVLRKVGKSAKELLGVLKREGRAPLGEEELEQAIAEARAERSAYAERRHLGPDPSRE
jgi:antitoxin component of MazEF toxin-antitoxin module